MGWLNLEQSKQGKVEEVLPDIRLLDKSTYELSKTHFKILDEVDFLNVSKHVDLQSNNRVAYAVLPRCDAQSKLSID